jgi:ribonuclease D
MSTTSECVLIDRPEALRSLVDTLARVPRFAFDTESSGMHAHYEHVCLAQISIPGFDWLVDPLAVDLRELAPILADPGCTKVLHAGENDVAVLQREFAMQVHGLFDTMLAARVLGWAAVGLGDILAARFGHRTDKRWQRHDWSRRPLGPEAIDYARHDTHFLLELCDLEMPELVASEKLDELMHACERAGRTRPKPRLFDPDACWRIDGARKLDDPGRAVLRGLFALREEIARAIDRPLFRVVDDGTLMALARDRPRTAELVARTRGIGNGPGRRHAARIADTIARCSELPPPSPPPAPPRDEPRLARFEALRTWRRKRAAARGLEPDIVLGREALAALAEQAPRTPADLAASEILDAWELERYADEIVAVLAPMR